MKMVILSAFVFVSLLFGGNFSPNETHAVLNISYTNFEDVPQVHKKLTFVGHKNPKNRIVVKTDDYGEVSFLIPREDTYVILCESLTGPFECGTTPYVSLKASTGGLNIAFDDTRAELKGVTFKAGSAELVPNSLKTLDVAIAGLKRNKAAIVEIEGHTSSEGGEAFNQKLSEDRANSVRTYMIGHGIDGTRIKTVGYGYSKPRASNDTEAGREQNRRIEIRVVNASDVGAVIEE